MRRLKTVFITGRCSGPVVILLILDRQGYWGTVGDRINILMTMSDYSVWWQLAVSPIIYSNTSATHGGLLAPPSAGLCGVLLTSELDSMLDMSISMLLAG